VHFDPFYLRRGLRCAAENQQQTKGTYPFSQFITSDPYQEFLTQRRKDAKKTIGNAAALCAFA